jgi:glycosyltransferase involved in cell wall biosynthesis
VVEVTVFLLNQYYAPAAAPTARFLSDVGEDLARAGHRVSVVCSRRSYPDPSIVYPARETIRQVSVYRTWTTGFGRWSSLGRMLDYAGFVIGAARILALHREIDVVVSLTTPPMVATLGLALSRLRGASSLLWVMDVYPQLACELGVLGRRSLVTRLLDRLGRYMLKRSDGVIALGETMAGRLHALGAKRVTVIHNWADGRTIRPCPAQDNELRAARGWEDRFVILYSGNLGLAHEFDTVLGSAELLRDEPRFLFAFVGEGPRLAEVRQKTQRRGLPNVEFHPQVGRDDLGQSLTSADVHLVTLREGLAGLLVSSKIYGILAAGRPTLYVGPPEGEIPEILREGRCGTLHSVSDSAGLAAAIRRYDAEPAGRMEEGRRARQLFEGRFTKERGLQAHRRLIESLDRTSE